LTNSDVARQIQEDALGSPLVNDEDSSSSQPPSAPPIIDYRKLPEFNPLSAGLMPDFRLSKFCELRGRGCRVPPTMISNMMIGVNSMAPPPPEEDEKKVGIGIDCTITPIKKGGYCIVSNTDMFYPIMDDPYIMGRVACVSLLSDMYAMGVVDIDNILMYLGISAKLTQAERDIIIPLMLKGFKDAASEAGTRVSGGQTVINPWLMLGGVATSICAQEEYIVPDSAIAGDVLVLTKPLGTGVALNCYQWLHSDRMSKLKMIMTEEDVKKSYKRAIDIMGRSNRGAARLLHKYNAHAATDIAGLGLLGHALHLANSQKNEVSFVIHNLPIISKMAAVAKSYGTMFNLAQGESSECSGGLLICLPREQAAAFCKDIEKEEGYQSWIIGIVESGDRSARIIDKPRIIDVPSKDKPDELW